MTEMAPSVVVQLSPTEVEGGAPRRDTPEVP
jgi:hypothetical protein